MRKLGRLGFPLFLTFFFLNFVFLVAGSVAERAGIEWLVIASGIWVLCVVLPMVVGMTVWAVVVIVRAWLDAFRGY